MRYTQEYAKILYIAETAPGIYNMTLAAPVIAARRLPASSSISSANLIRCAVPSLSADLTPVSASCGWFLKFGARAPGGLPAGKKGRRWISSAAGPRLSASGKG